jgi:hypothetical protein
MAKVRRELVALAAGVLVGGAAVAVVPGALAPTPATAALTPADCASEGDVATLEPRLAALERAVAALAGASDRPPAAAPPPGDRTEALLGLDAGEPALETVSLRPARAVLATRLATASPDRADAGAVPLRPRRAFVTLRAVRYRQGPDLDEPVLGTLRAGEVLIADRAAGAWRCFTTGEGRGCVHGRWLRPARPSD